MTEFHPRVEEAVLPVLPLTAEAPADDASYNILRRRIRREKLFFRLCTLPAIFVTSLVAIIPLGLLLINSLRNQRSGAFSFEYYIASFGSAFFMRTLATTILMAFCVAVISILLALPMAYLLARRTLLRNFIMPIITIPRMLPFVVIGYAMILLLAPMTGVVNKVLLGLGILSQPAFILFDWPGQAIAFTYSGIVVATAVLTGVLMSVDPQLEDAAVSMGATRLRTFFVITIPLAIPGIIAASALIFTSVVTSYAIPVMLNGRVPYMISLIVSANLLTLQQPHLAYAQAVIVSMLAIGVTALSQYVLLRYGRQGGGR
ncbi:ABC transporter permease subunit [Pararhizobium sp. BT-229]|uniref:ABC transporter permease n=1 Tax=Pararhizobium sp. BT-229 TaxID=2986923 RepID=UPI0021F74A62|nr:ABC transporter permease subunit [Pararhizobium sp. BT-229]MCV9961782.1 ABC transporter permease subunit [Pararhizobium sp. BT-229]